MNVEEITQALMQDARNISYTNRHIPPVYQIHSQARLLIIGQAPGRQVEKTLIPFHDPSGKKLMEWLNLSEEEFYGKQVAIMPMDFYYPGKGKTGDWPPRSFIAKEYHQKLRALMPNIELTVLVGRYAIDYYLKETKYRNLTETVKHYQEYLPDYFPIVHPSPLNFRWQKNNPWFVSQVVPDLKRQVARVLK